MVTYKHLRDRANSLIKRDRVRKAEDDLKQGKHPFRVARSLLGVTDIAQHIRLVDANHDANHVVDSEEEVTRTLNDFFMNKQATILPCRQAP